MPFLHSKKSSSSRLSVGTARLSAAPQSSTLTFLVAYFTKKGKAANAGKITMAGDDGDDDDGSEERIINDDDDDDSNDDDDDQFLNTRMQIRQRRWLVAFSLAITFLFVGATLAWGPMQLLLERNGAFHSKCDDGDTAADDGNDAADVCPAQTAALLNVPLVAFVTLLVAPALGHIADHCGAPVTAVFMGSCFVAGTLLLTVAAAYGDGLLDWLLYVAFGCLAMGTWNGLILTVHTGLYFVGHTRSRVIFTMNAMVDAGGVTYLGLWGIGEVAPDAQVSHLLSGYLGLACVLVAGHVYFFLVAVPEEEQGYSNCDELVQTESPVTLQVTMRSTQHDSASEVEKESDNKEEQIVDCEENALSASVRFNSMVENILAEPDHSTSNLFPDHSTSNSIPDHSTSHSISISNYEYGETSPSNIDHKQEDQDEYVIVADRPSRNQILSRPFLWLALFFSIHVTTANFVLTTTRDFLAYLGDDEYNNKYLNIFTLLLPASLVALPGVDWVLLKTGFYGGFTMINLLALGYLLIRLFSDSLNVQILGFALFSFYRCFLFGISLSFLPTFLSPDLIGKAAGLLNMCTGMLSFINIGLADLAIDRLDGDFFIPTLVYTLLLIPCAIAVQGIRTSIQLEAKAKEEQDRPPLDTGSHPSFRRFTFMENLPRESLVHTEPIFMNSPIVRRLTWSGKEAVSKEPPLHLHHSAKF